MRLAVGAFGVGIALVGLTAAGSARAFEREWHLGAAAGVSDGKGLALSPALGVYAAYGLSDVFDARLELTARGYGFTGDDDPHALAAMAGLVYKLDVLSWIPWGGVYAGYMTFLEAPHESLPYNRQDAVLGLGGGLDYAVSRSFGLGVSVRFDDALSHADNGMMDAMLRAEYRWGW